MLALCETMRLVLVANGCFPTGGIQVRAWPTPVEAVADGYPDYAYADLVLRMGAGRSQHVKRGRPDADGGGTGVLRQ